MLLVKGGTSSVTEDLCWTTLPTSLCVFFQITMRVYWLHFLGSRSSSAPPPCCCSSEDPCRHLGSQHGGAGRHAVCVLRPRCHHFGHLQPATQWPSARQDRWRVLQLAGGTDTRLRPAERGRREDGRDRDGSAATCGESSVHLASSPERTSERETAGKDQEHVHLTHSQPVLMGWPDSYSERSAKRNYLLVWKYNFPSFVSLLCWCVQVSMLTC